MTNKHNGARAQWRWQGRLSAMLAGAAIGFGAIPATGAQAAVGYDALGEYVLGRVVVMPRAGVDDAEVARAAAAHGGKARRIGASRIHVVELPAQASEEAVARLLARNPRFEFAELDRRFPPAFTPNDPYYPNQWHTAKINAAAAWDVAQGNGVTIAILDSGVDGSHPDLSAQMVPGWNVYDNNADTSDIHGHGTAVAGAAAATLNNGAGYAAIAGKARIMPIRMVGSDLMAEASKVAAAITWAADHGARIASISYSGTAANSTVHAAADYMRAKGGLVVVSAGNAGAEEPMPATSKLIPVSATDRNDALASFSSWGSYVAMSAPGVDVPCTVRGGGYGWCYGTSLATPVVAGTVAAMMSARPALTASQVESLLYATAADLGPGGRDKQYGHGRVDAGAAVKAAAAYQAATDATAPTASIVSPAGGATVSGTVAVDVSASDNVGVAKVELRVNGTTVATDTAAPWSFAWDSTKLADGSASLVAVAYDAAGNAGASVALGVNVANGGAKSADTTPPVVTIVSPTGGSIGTSVTIKASASDDAGAAGIAQSLYIDGALKATVNGGTLNYKWNTRKVKAGMHTIDVVARDAAGNTASTSVQVTR